MVEPVACYRCARPSHPDRLDIEAWVGLHAGSDGAALFVCPDCQSEREQEARELLLLFD